MVLVISSMRRRLRYLPPADDEKVAKAWQSSWGSRLNKFICKCNTKEVTRRNLRHIRGFSSKVWFLTLLFSPFGPCLHRGSKTLPSGRGQGQLCNFVAEVDLGSPGGTLEAEQRFC